MADNTCLQYISDDYKEINLMINKIFYNAYSTKTYRFIPMDNFRGIPPIFKAGQSLKIRFNINGKKAIKTYFISSSPSDAVNKGYYEITLKENNEDIVSKYIEDNWNIGTFVNAIGPQGFFYHDPENDTRDLVCIAGGLGATPFRSMMREIVEQNLNMKLTLIYETNKPSEFLLKKEFEDLEHESPNRLRVVYICNEVGHITADCIVKHSGDLSSKTFFICGPKQMYSVLNNQLKKLDVPKHRIKQLILN